MGAKIPHFETMDEHELNYIKVGAPWFDIAYRQLTASDIR